MIVFHSVEDHVVEPVNSRGAAGRASSSTDVTEVVLEDSYHVATLDNDAPLIFDGLGRLDPRAARRRRGAAGGAAVTAAAGRGRRDNGLDATLWSPLRDVDPRVGEHLLDVLQAAGIAAYLEPSADVGPYTRTVFLPSPPTDRLFVDRARRARGPRRRRRARPPAARARRDRAAAARPSRPPSGREIDEDAEWARIVAGLRGRARAGRSSPTSPSDAPPPGAARAGGPRPARTSTTSRRRRRRCRRRPPPRSTRCCWWSPASLLVGAPGAAAACPPTSAWCSGSRRSPAASAMLVSRMRDRSDDDGDDGAVV